MADTPLPPPPARPPEWGPHPEEPPVGASPRPRKPRRIFFWVFLTVQILFLVGIIAAVNDAPDLPDSCVGMTGDALRLCKDSGEVGTAIGVGLLIALWAAVDIILATTYGIHRLSRRQRA
ncbi:MULTISPECIES: hypothetical protein [unclassified Streptomyces]|uniref:hypothetical protein n=1 Tax=unclassified Streptomyces TaxID=2593676 RepID=UPI0004BD419A|nr:MULTISPECIES: hypothetical protein [unclassified Streptomyces]